MTNEKKKSLNAKTIVFYGIVAMSLIVSGYYFFNPKQNEAKYSVQAINTPTSESAKVDSSVQNNKNITTPEPTTNVAANTAQKPQTETIANTQDTQKVASSSSQDNGAQSSPTTSSNSQDANKAKQTDSNYNQSISPTTQTEIAPSPTTQTETTPSPSPKTEPTAKPIEVAIKILRSEVTSQAKFYPYKLDNVNMEVIAVKASDGTIRTALNTCQVCFDSGKGYYIQVGEYLVCQNCKNKFHIDQVEKVKGGCNPVPILEENKTVLVDSIVISKDFMAGQKEFFSKWKK